MLRRRRQRIATLAGVAVASLMAASTVSPALAAPAPRAHPALDRAAGRLPTSGRVTNHDVTLVTGDTVHLSVSPNGVSVASVEVAPRPDARQVFTQTLVGGGHVYVIPSDAGALIADHRVDLRLFDVQKLVEDGYADGSRSTLPVIVQYAGTPAATTPQARAQADAQVRARADALPASTPVRTLGSINAAALSVTKADTEKLWSTLDPKPAARSLGAGVNRIWLDGRVRASLDVSVPMIGAPAAWSAGYDGTGVTVAILDTGIDETHPDLAGKVVASKSFVGTDTVKDGFGHGTHVASTIVGSGAASGGKYRGVAPGASLVIGKVLDDTGHGGESGIIDGMEWAANSGARIVSMSLGSGTPSDGTDLMSQAVNDLTASTGTLFVIAAGNEGPGASTVAAPGAADAALTVAAVSKTDQLANFSNRGPRLHDYALKPEIAAPGVNITAARAAGTQLGPVAGDNDRYVTISGTSMATPHVAGSAAILLQEHPGWTSHDVKAALTGTSKDDGYSVYEQGAGRVDVAAAYRATVLADTKVDFGRLRYPHTGPAVTKTLTYRNTGSAAVTLNLAASLKDPDGTAGPEGMLTVTPSTVDVPAGGSATATVAFDPKPGPYGAFSGAVTATGTGVSLRTPVGAFKEPKGFDLNIDTVVPKKAVDGALSSVLVKRVDVDAGGWTLLDGGASLTAHLEEGVYEVSRAVQWSATAGDLLDLTIMLQPEVALTQDTTITLDANTARRVDVMTRDRPTEPYGTTLGAWRIPAGTTTPWGVLTGQSPYLAHYWVTPTKPVTVGRFLLEHQHMLGTPLITASVPARGRLAGLDLHPRYQNYTVFVPKLDGTRELPVVDVGTASAQELAGVDLRGKVALVALGDRYLAPILGGQYPQEAVSAIAHAGAAAILAYGDTGWPVMGIVSMPPGVYPLPVAALTAEEGSALHDRLSRGPATVRIVSHASIPDLYTLSYMEEGSVPESLSRTVSDSQLSTLRQEFHADRPTTSVQTWGVRRPELFRPDDYSASFMTMFLEQTYAPTSRTEHIGPMSDAMPWFRGYDAFDLDRTLASGLPSNQDAYLGSSFTDNLFDHPSVRTEVWGQSPMLPGEYVAPRGLGELKGEAVSLCAVCRYSGVVPDADVLPVATVTVDGYNHNGELTTFSRAPGDEDGRGAEEIHLYRDGTELPQQSLGGLLPYYVLPQDAGTYRLTDHFENHWKQAGYGRASDTTWTFRSSAPTGKDLPVGYDALGLCADRCSVEPLLFLGYQFDLGMDNRLPAPGVHRFTVTAYRQPTVGAAAPRVAGMKVSASFDGGRTWHRQFTWPVGGGKFSVILVQPGIPGATGTVSLRTEAWDAAGNRVEQTVPDAYGLVRRH